MIAKGDHRQFSITKGALRIIIARSQKGSRGLFLGII
jgi:hypothetical protein